MKKVLVIPLLIIVLPFIFWPIGLSFGEKPIVAETTFAPEAVSLSLSGKIIALDAGHGGEYSGAVYPYGAGGKSIQVAEKDVNLAVAYTLKTKLEGSGAKVVLSRECDETIARRKDRVDIVKKTCKELYGRECDVLVSVHHNASSDSNHDGMMVIYNNKEDFVLATFLHDSLLAGLFNNNPSYDERYDSGGYGMTVYFTPASLTEGYYITNNCEAELYLYGKTIDSSNCDSSVYFNNDASQKTLTCADPDDNELHEFYYYPDRVNQEAQALYQGLLNYFNSPTDDGNGGNECPPGKQKQGKC